MFLAWVEKSRLAYQTFLTLTSKRCQVDRRIRGHSLDARSEAGPDRSHVQRVICSRAQCRGQPFRFRAERRAPGSLKRYCFHPNYLKERDCLIDVTVGIGLAATFTRTWLMGT